MNQAGCQRHLRPGGTWHRFGLGRKPLQRVHGPMGMGPWADGADGGGGMGWSGWSHGMAEALPVLQLGCL